jgi:hypothetical protein
MKYNRIKSALAVWWEFYALGALELQCFAISVLSQGSSASVHVKELEQLQPYHSKKRNRLLSENWKILFMFAVTCNWL